MLLRLLRPLWQRLTKAEASGPVKGFSLWMYPRGVTDDGTPHAEIIVMFKEWSYRDVQGLTFADYFVYSDDDGRGLEAEVLKIFEDHMSVAALIDSGKLVRIGPAPSYVPPSRDPNAELRLGAWG